MSILGNQVITAAKVDKVEMVVLEINFGKGRKDDILVHFGDDPRDLAIQFVRKHSLKDSAIVAVCATLEQTIADFHRDHDVATYFEPPMSPHMSPPLSPPTSPPTSPPISPPMSQSPTDKSPTTTPDKNPNRNAGKSSVRSPERSSERSSGFLERTQERTSDSNPDKNMTDKNYKSQFISEEKEPGPEEIPEVYKGQPPVELQVDGLLPEVLSRSEAMEENIRIINGHVINYTAADVPQSMGAAPMASVASSRYGSIMTYDSMDDYSLREQRDQNQQQNTQREQHTVNQQHNTQNQNNQQNQHQQNVQNEKIQKTDKTDKAENREKEQKGEKENKVAVESSIHKAFQPPSASQIIDERDEFVLSKSASDGGNEDRFTLSDFSTIKRPLSAPTPNRTGSGRSFGGTISDKIAAAKMRSSGDKEKGTSGLSGQENGSSHYTGESGGGGGGMSGDAGNMDDIYSNTDAVIISIDGEYYTKSVTDEIPSRDSLTPAGSTHGSMHGSLHGSMHNMQSMQGIESGLSSPFNELSVNIGRAGAQKVVPKLYYKPAVSGHVSARAGTTPKGSSPRRPVSERLFDYFGSNNLSSKEIGFIAGVEGTVTTDISPATTIDTAASSVDPQAVINQQRVVQELSDTVFKIPSNETLFHFISTENSNNSFPGSDPGSHPGSQMIDSPLMFKHINSADLESRMESDSRSDPRSSGLGSTSPRSSTHSPIMRGGGKRSGASSPTPPVMTPPTPVIPTTPSTPATSVTPVTALTPIVTDRTDTSPSSIRSVTPLSVPVSAFFRVSLVSPVTLHLPLQLPVSPRYDYIDPTGMEKGSRNQGPIQSHRDRGDRGERGYSPKGERENREMRGDRGYQGRGRGDRSARSPKGERGDKVERGAVERGDRGGGGDGSARGITKSVSTEEERRFYTLKSLGGKNEALVPSASVLALNKEFRPESHLTGGNTKKLTPNSRKSVSDRLHDSANKSRIQREKRITEAQEERDQQRAAAIYTINDVSKSMVSNKNQKDICSRLYADGVKVQEKKKQRARNSRVEWSCSRCGVFQVHVDSGVSNINNMGDRNIENTDRSSSSSGQDQVCGNCGYNQRSSTPFRPTNHSQSFDGGGYRPNSYYTGEESVTGSQLSYYTSNKATVFDFLYADKQHETVMNRAIRINNRNTAQEFTFKPTISEGSNILLQRRVDEIRERESYPDREYYETPEGYREEGRGEGGYGQEGREGGGYREEGEYTPHRSRNQSPGGNSRRGRSPIGHKTSINSNNGNIVGSSSFAQPSKNSLSDRKRERASSAPNVRNLAHYLTIPAAERLFYVRGSPPRALRNRRSKVPSNYDDEEEYHGYGNQDRNQDPGSQRKKVQMSSEKFQGLVDRLAYEYKDKDKRRAKAIADATSTDPNTGLKYFHPILPPRPSSGSPKRGDPAAAGNLGQWWRGRDEMDVADRGSDRGMSDRDMERRVGGVSDGGVDRGVEGCERGVDQGGMEGYPYESNGPRETNPSNRASRESREGRESREMPPPQGVQGARRKPQEVYRDLIRKDDERQERFRQAQLQAENAIDGQLSRSSKITLPMSETILKESNERHLRELFTHLLATTPSFPSHSTQPGHPTHLGHPAYPTQDMDQTNSFRNSTYHSRNNSNPSMTRLTRSADELENLSNGNLFGDFECGSEITTPDFNNLSGISSPGGVYPFNRPYGPQAVTPQGWESKRLDLGQVNVSNLPVEVAALVNQVRDERTRRTPVKKGGERGEGALSLGHPANPSSSHPSHPSHPSSIEFELSRSTSTLGTATATPSDKNVPVDFQEFSRLVARCLQRREGQPGRGYLYLPKSLETSRRRVEDERGREMQECTFHPNIDHVSVAMSMAREGRESKQHTPRGRGERGEITPRSEDRERRERSNSSLSAQGTMGATRERRESNSNLSMLGASVTSETSKNQSSAVPTMKEFLADDSLSRASFKVSSDTERSLGVSIGGVSGGGGSGMGGGSGGVSGGRSGVSVGGRSDKSAPRRHTPIEDILREEGVKTSSRMEAKRKDALRSEQELHPFKPTLFKPPRHLVARYKGEKSNPPPPPDSDQEDMEFAFSARIKEIEATDKSVSTEVSKISTSQKQFDRSGVSGVGEIDSSFESKGEKGEKGERRGGNGGHGRTRTSLTRTSLSEFYNSAYHPGDRTDTWDGSSSSQLTHKEMIFKEMVLPWQQQLEQANLANLSKQKEQGEQGGERDQRERHTDDASVEHDRDLSEEGKSSTEMFIMCADSPSKQPQFSPSPSASSPVILNIPPRYKGSPGLNKSQVSQMSEVESALHSNRSSLNGSFTLTNVTNVSHDIIPKGERALSRDGPARFDAPHPPNPNPTGMKPSWDANKRIVYDDENVLGPAYRTVTKQKARPRPSNSKGRMSLSQTSLQQQGFQYLQSQSFSDGLRMDERESERRGSNLSLGSRIEDRGDIRGDRADRGDSRGDRGDRGEVRDEGRVGDRGERRAATGYYAASQNRENKAFVPPPLPLEIQRRRLSDKQEMH